jgi:hypothetical protein
MKDWAVAWIAAASLIGIALWTLKVVLQVI